MKQKLKALIVHFIASLNLQEKKISIQDLSIFLSVLIAAITLREHRKGRQRIDTRANMFSKDFISEIQIIRTRFPELYRTFGAVHSILRKTLFETTIQQLKNVFQDKDLDVDDIISWSYQFLKRDLEKSAFKKIGQGKMKLENSDLLFTTQFFTDRYMVKYLVDESLAGLNGDVRDVVIIDCACGGGNFLTYSFDRLFESHSKLFPKWSEKRITEEILENCIVGYDLDSTLAKIAALSLFVKACSYATPNPNIKIKIYGGVSGDKLGFMNSKVISDKIGNTTFESQLRTIEGKGKTKLFLTNPPFMGKRDMDIGLKAHLLTHFPEGKGDLCVSFIQRMMQISSSKDILGIVSQNNWMYLSSLKNFRKFFLSKHTIKSCIDLGSNAFENINGEKTNVALCVVGGLSDEKSEIINLKDCRPSEKRIIVENRNFPPQLIFRFNQNAFLKNDNFEFNYQINQSFAIIRKLKLYSEFANPMQGTSTGNNSEFVKFAWEVNGSPDWKLVSKGGGFSKWIGMNYYKVKWGVDAEKIRANKGSALRNLDKMSSTQLVYSDTGTLGLNVRILKQDQVFIASGPGIQVLGGDPFAHLAFLNSRIATVLLKLINPKFTISAGYISKIPVPADVLDSSYIAERSKKCLELKEAYLSNKLPNFEFRHPDYSAIKDLDAYCQKLILADLENDYQRLLLESEIEVEIKKKYNFGAKELAAAKSIVGESPFVNKAKSVAIDLGILDLHMSEGIDTNCLSTSHAINGYAMGSESLLESLSYKLNINPIALIDLIRTNISALVLTKAKYYRDFIHKIILKELGVIHISKYSPIEMTQQSLLTRLLRKYEFLKANPGSDLEHLTNITVREHHRASFFNKPMILISGNSLIVGSHV